MLPNPRGRGKVPGFCGELRVHDLRIFPLEP
jgi:hypothetical protein